MKQGTWRKKYEWLGKGMVGGGERFTSESRDICLEPRPAARSIAAALLYMDILMLSRGAGLSGRWGGREHVTPPTWYCPAFRFPVPFSAALPPGVAVRYIFDVLPFTRHLVESVNAQILIELRAEQPRYTFNPANPDPPVSFPYRLPVFFTRRPSLPRSPECVLPDQAGNGLRHLADFGVKYNQQEPDADQAHVQQ